MKLNIKTKLILGLGFLFLVILLIGSVGAVYTHTIAKESKAILKDNYESIQYSKAMFEALDEMPADRENAYSKFDTNLRKQETNITESGEAAYTARARSLFEKMKKGEGNSDEKSNIRKVLYKVMELNMQAILRKNNQAQATADRVLAYIGIIGGICFLIVFTFIINFPGYIANPIRVLTEGIKQIATGNYRERLHFTSKDEFGELADAFNSMAGKLEQYENSNLARLMFEKKRTETIINNMNDAIIGLDEKRIVLFVNLRAVQLLGLGENDMVGKPAPELALRNDLLSLLIGNAEMKSPIRIFADSKESYFTREIISVTSEGKPIGEVILLKNITQYEEQDQAKTNFIATISHELKTPIASIKLSSKLLEDERVGQLNHEQQQLVYNIKEDSERLLRLTAEVLNMAQVETGKIQLNFQPVKAETVVSYAVDSLKFQAEQKQVEIVTDLPPDLPGLNADLEKTVWVVVNLLSNAIRYSPEGSKVILSVSREEKEVRFAVKDFGKGIEHQYQDKIFNKFFRVPGSDKTGTGLGLAIAKEFILAQKGHIGLISEPGKGATFFFYLPAHS